MRVENYEVGFDVHGLNRFAPYDLNGSKISAFQTNYRNRHSIISSSPLFRLSIALCSGQHQGTEVISYSWKFGKNGRYG